MRNATINMSSKIDEVLGVLTGVWNEYDADGWHIVKTPFFVAMSATLKSGKNLLPIAPKKTASAVWTGLSNSGAVFVKAGQKVIELPEDAYVEINLFGATL